MTLMRSLLRPLCTLMMRAPADRQSHTLLHTLRKLRSHLLVVFIFDVQRYSPLTFDPNFPMMPGMRFPPTMAGPIPISPDEGLEMDEHGNVNWRLAWLKEIGHLQQVTAEQEKAGVDPEWYRMMLFRVRTALMPPPINPEVMHGMPPHMQAPPNAADIQQQQQQQQQQQGSQ